MTFVVRKLFKYLYKKGLACVNSASFCINLNYDVQFKWSMPLWASAKHHYRGLREQIVS